MTCAPSLCRRMAISRPMPFPFVRCPSIKCCIRRVELHTCTSDHGALALERDVHVGSSVACFGTNKKKKKEDNSSEHSSCFVSLGAARVRAGHQGMSTPPFDKSELKQGLPLAGTPTPTPSPSSIPDAKSSSTPQKRVLVVDDDIDEFRLGHVTRVNHMDALAEMKAAAAARPPLPPPPSPALVPSATKTPPSVVRGSSTYFTGSNAPAPGGKKRPLVINTNQVSFFFCRSHLVAVVINYC